MLHGAVMAVAAMDMAMAALAVVVLAAAMDLVANLAMVSTPIGTR